MKDPEHGRDEGEWSRMWAERCRNQYLSSHVDSKTVLSRRLILLCNLSLPIQLILS